MPFPTPIRRTIVASIGSGMVSAGPSTNSIGCFFRFCFCGGASMSITSCGSGSKNRGLRKNASCACGSGLSSRAGGA